MDPALGKRPHRYRASATLLALHVCCRMTCILAANVSLPSVRLGPRNDSLVVLARAPLLHGANADEHLLQSV